MSCLHASVGRAAVGIIAVLSGCTSEAPREWHLPERSVPPDIAALPADFDTKGGPVLIRLTQWPDSSVLAQLESAGLEPLPGYSVVERLDSLGMSFAGGTMTPGGLERILALPYVIRVEPAPATPRRSRAAKEQQKSGSRPPTRRS
jgi:hypothetical protein